MTPMRNRRPADHAAVLAAARAFVDLTGNWAAVAGAVAENAAALALGAELSPVNWPGHDAIMPDGRAVQVKARCLTGNRTGTTIVNGLQPSKPWDLLVFVMLDGSTLDVTEMHLVERADFDRELATNPNPSLLTRGSVSISVLRRIGRTLAMPR